MGGARRRLGVLCLCVVQSTLVSSSLSKYFCFSDFLSPSLSGRVKGAVADAARARRKTRFCPGKECHSFLVLPNLEVRCLSFAQGPRKVGATFLPAAYRFLLDASLL